MEPGESGKYAQGGARLAVAAGAPVVPVAVDSGRCWPRGDWRKYPGTITVRIGPTIDTADRSPAIVNREARDWIEVQVADLEGRTAPTRETATAG